jgi:hypothetical protein
LGGQENMKKTFVFFNKMLVFMISVFFIGTSIVSSANNTINYDSVNNQKNIIACDHLAYVGGSGEFCGLYEFILNDPGNLTCVWPGGGGSGDFLSGSTWTNDGRWLACEYGSGVLWELDLETGEMWSIGGGGTGCNGLAWDPVYNRLYATSGYALYEYNPETGEQDYIGSHGVSNTMIALAIDSEGVCYAWDVLFSGNSTLFTIDLESGEATIVGSLGLTLTYAQDGDFCKRDDILYLAAHTTSPDSGSYLYECDEDTGSCTLVGKFQEDVNVAIFVVPWNHPPNAPTIDGPTSGKPNTAYDFTFVSTDPEEDAVMYIINWGDNNTDWTEYGDSGGEIKVKHTWTSEGNFTIKVQAIDIYDAESDWTEFEISIPRTRTTTNIVWYHWFLEKFQIIERILNLIR